MRKAKLERNSKWRLVISAGEKDRGSDEVQGRIFLLPRILLWNAFAVKELFC